MHHGANTSGAKERGGFSGPGQNSLLTYGLAALAGMLLVRAFLGTPIREISYSEFRTRLEAGEIEQVVVSPRQVRGMLRAEVAAGGDTRAFRTVRVEDAGLIDELRERGVEFRGDTDGSFLGTLVSWLLPVALLVGFWAFAMRRMGSQSGVMAFGKSKARIYAEHETGVTFADAAGQEEAKEELAEIIRFLREPDRFRLLGGKLPRGVLLVGPPGTGKTLLAKAVAGEASVPFFSISGSEFVELFVGMGAARVRDLFAQAQKMAPCIVFIDELDALGKARGLPGTTGGHDERESTLNQLLVEMDGFDTAKGVVILAATNRPEVLDPALLRAGRFDRQVLVDRPDRAGREAILKVHAENVRLAADVDLSVVAQRTPGFVGADLANLINEAALLAARREKTAVDMGDIDEAIDRVVAGLQKRSRIINPKEKRVVAVHELGHALVATCTPGADPVHKISIIPRGVAALGYTQQLPTDDRHLLTRSELEARIDVLLGGRAAEDVVFSEVSTGAHDDLQRATELVRSMLQEYGMGETLGALAFPRRRQAFLGESAWPEPQRAYSEDTARALDEEMKTVMRVRMQRVSTLLRQKRTLLERLTEILLEREVLDGAEFERLLRQGERCAA
jgi:cell division protease FtsH